VHSVRIARTAVDGDARRFIDTVHPSQPAALGAWDISPLRDADRVARVDYVFGQMDTLDELRQS